MPSSTVYDARRCHACDHPVEGCSTERDDSRRCPSCGRPSTPCSRCGSWTDQARPTVGHELICPACAADGFTTCSSCDYLTADPTNTVTGRSICELCADNQYSSCNRCDGLTDDLQSTADQGMVCERCVTAFWYCDRCDSLINSGSLCQRCSRESDAYDAIYGYSYKPVPQFHGDGPLYLGLELEINCPYNEISQCASTAIEALGSLGYLKEDGSIDMGFELVTHPMSYEWAIEHFPWRLLTALQELGCDGDNAGLHVHVNREGFDSTAHRYRWLKFIYRNENSVCRIARRRSEQWASFRPTDCANAKSYAKGVKGDARHRAINTVPDKTYEMRVFASSLDPREVQAALGLAAASVEYTRHLTVADVRRTGWSWTSFLAWTTAHPEYQPLNQEWTDLACAC